MKQHFSKRFVALCLVLTGFLSCVSLFAQERRTITLSENNITLKEAFDAIERQSDYTFIIRNNDVDLSTRVSVQVRNAGIDEALRQILRGKGISYEPRTERILTSMVHGRWNSRPHSPNSRYPASATRR